MKLTTIYLLKSYFLRQNSVFPDASEHPGQQLRGLENLCQLVSADHKILSTGKKQSYFDSHTY